MAFFSKMSKVLKFSYFYLGNEESEIEQIALRPCLKTLISQQVFIRFQV